MQKENILIIILNWNGWQDTQECLLSLKKIDYPAFKIAVVDNGSDNDCELVEAFANKHFDGCQTIIKEEIPGEKYVSQNFAETKFTLIKNNENLGFAKANNIGIRYAIALGCKLVLLLNNDTVAAPDFLSVLADAFVHSAYSAATPQIRYYKPQDIIWNCGAKIKRYNEHYYYKDKPVSSVQEKNLVKEVAFATGCALLMKIEETGLLTEKFFFGEEDFEMALRLRKEGKKIACILNSVIYHKESASINRSSVKVNKMFVHYLNRLVDTKDYAKITWPLYIFYRTFRFFLDMCFNRHISLYNSFYYSSKFLAMAFRLTEVSKQTFFNILSYPIENA